MEYSLQYSLLCLDKVQKHTPCTVIQDEHLPRLRSRPSVVAEPNMQHQRPDTVGKATGRAPGARRHMICGRASWPCRGLLRSEPWQLMAGAGNIQRLRCAGSCIGLCMRRPCSCSSSSSSYPAAECRRFTLLLFAAE